MNPALILTTLCLCTTVGGLHAAPTSRASDYTDALAQAKSTGNDIVVLQRGSDWNRLGETIYQNVWRQPAFVAALGEGFILTTVDRPEQPGAPALGSAGDAAGLIRFKRTIAADAPLPTNEVTEIKADGGASYQRRPDGSWLVNDPNGQHNPAGDTLTLTLLARQGGQVLRLDFLPDASLPNACAGRAPNGNFVLSEITVSMGGQPVAATLAWANAAEGAMLAAQTIDGIHDQPANGWNAAAHQRQPRVLMLSLAAPVRANATLKVTLACRAQWPQHVPACLRAAVLDDPAFASTLAQITSAESLAAKNAGFSWWDGGLCPRVALLDSEGRAIDAENKPRADLTPQSLAARVKQLRDKRLARDEWLARAEKAQGPEKAELLRQALNVLGIVNWPGNGNCYQIIQQKIKEADPQDVSGVTRCLAFGGDPRGGVPWAKPAWNEALDTQGGKRVLTDADYQTALARVDKELADPRNKILTHENIQRMMLAKFHIYRGWKGHEDERFRIQQEIVNFDPTTFWGIGGNGYLGMYGRSTVPFLTYGWKPNQLKAGSNIWRMADTGYFFDHPGSYKITLTDAGGADQLKVKRLALLDGDTVVAESRPDTEFGPGPLAKLEVIWDCKSWQANRNYVFLAELETTDGHTDVHGRFAVEPWFIEPVAKTPLPSTDYAKVQADLLAKLLAPLTKNPVQAVASNSTRLDLARHELLRRCGANAINPLARRQGGGAFLAEFTGDLDWLESFLANDECAWPQAIENLRFLHANARAGDLAVPLYRRLATAIALAAGEMNRYRLLDRFNDIVRVHREGLLHVSFDQLDTREMRWAVLLAGTAADFQFIVDATQLRLGEYLGACWGIAYIDTNAYGYSVQGWGYVDPWCHYYGTGTGDRPFRAQRQVGGVCGTLSGFGATCAKGHGVMSVTVGQPGHCAYVVRLGQEWPTGYDVSGPETNGASVYEGTGFPTMNRLYEVIHADRASYLQASRLAWAAHVMQDHRRTLVRIQPGLKYWDTEWSGAWVQALAAQPINYQLWLERIKLLESVPDLPAGTWQKLIAAIAPAFGPYHEAGWALINRCYAKAAPAMKPMERMALLLKCHQCLTQAKAPLFMGYNFGGVLNAQADSLGDPVLALEFLGQLLKIHHSADPARNRVFGDVMNWGNSRFSANPATAAAYAKVIGSFFTTLGKEADPNQMRVQITAGIRKASEAGDLAAYQLWSTMAAKLLPPTQAAEIHLTPQQLAAPPKAPPFAGVLLSKDGLLQTSSACQYDRPLTYRAILDGSAPGYFDTNNEEKPWVQVALAGDADLSGIVLVNRYELPAEHEEFKWIAPFKVLVSSDGKSWIEVATGDHPDVTVRIDLAGKAPRARFVRIERQAPTDKTKPPGRLHLRNLLVYGKKLY